MRLSSFFRTLCFSFLLPSASLWADTLVRGLPTNPVSLDPHRFLGTPEATVLKDMYEGLTSQDELGKPAPGAAESWSVSEDGRVWSFHIRKGLTWSDGSPLTSADFLYSFRRLADPATRAQYRWYLDLAGVVNSRKVAAGELSAEHLGVSAPDLHTLEIKLEAPRIWLPNLMTFPAFLPVSERAIKRCGPLWAEQKGCAVSNGPYRFLSLGDGRIRLGKNSAYRDPLKSSPEKVVWEVFGSILDELVAFREKKLDISSPIPAELGLVQGRKPLSDRQVRQLNTTYLVLNTRDPQLSLPVRKALAGILDRQALFPGGNQSDQAWTLIPPWTQGYLFQRLSEVDYSQGRRDEAARSILQQTGIDETNPVRLQLLTTHSHYRWVVNSIVVQWRRLPGVEVEVVSVGWEEYIDRLNRGDYQVLLNHWLAAYNDPSAFLLLGSRSFTFFPPGLMDESYENELQSAMSLDEPAEIYRQLEQKLLNSHSLIPLSHIRVSQWVQPEVKGFDIKNPEGWLPSYRLQLESGVKN
ncbi:peptide ABC transporter substrate-binding protein [Parendozoicomonas sp. Alg238-R29]|uniref:peptide ABC transporter substrate-binding protein n=1 Tax=Parendozoicomonas sp. Alg238-R29 TaxID=2993446 RepID=UPI00248D8948|nr:peptide ABC transporter substrate-binding protein [Parendozoicomonas sp. Alg238-R29]